MLPGRVKPLPHIAAERMSCGCTPSRGLLRGAAQSTSCWELRAWVAPSPGPPAPQAPLTSAPALSHEITVSKMFTTQGTSAALVCEARAGQMLYLPAGGLCSTAAAHLHQGRPALRSRPASGRPGSRRHQSQHGVTNADLAWVTDWCLSIQSCMHQQPHLCGAPPPGGAQIQAGTSPALRRHIPPAYDVGCRPRLPAGWFHEVTSYSTADSPTHMALNFWCGWCCILAPGRRVRNASVRVPAAQSAVVGMAWRPARVQHARADRRRAPPEMQPTSLPGTVPVARHAHTPVALHSSSQLLSGPDSFLHRNTLHRNTLYHNPSCRYHPPDNLERGAEAAMHQPYM